MTLVKFCGLFREEDIEYANILKPDFIGFVYAKSKRQISQEKSEYLKNKLHKNIKAVGVFLNNSVDEIIEICSKNIIDIIQLHGTYNKDVINTLKAKTNKQIISAINIKSADDILSIKHMEADYLLIDSANAGSGVAFNYKLLDEAKNKGFHEKFFLAGGLNIYNIEKALAYKPYGIDISSGIEKDGIKDFNLMKEIIYKVKGENI